MNNIIDENTYKEIQQLSAVYKTGYLELLRLNSIVYDDDIKEKLETGEYDNYVLDDDFLELLDIMAEVNITEKFFDPKVKSNILEILLLYNTISFLLILLTLKIKSNTFTNFSLKALCIFSFLIFKFSFLSKPK